MKPPFLRRFFVLKKETLRFLFIIKKWLVFSSCLLLWACPQKEDDGFACTEEFVYGLSISVTNAVTGQFITENITVTATDGNYSEELMSFQDFTGFFGAGERAGNYSIYISAEGYNEYTSETIVVKANQCHVIPEVRTFELQPL